MENWCSYKNILVHLLFSSFFFRHFTVLTISLSVFIQIIWFLARFEGYLKYYQRPVLNRSLSVFYSLSIFRSFAVQSWSSLSLLLVPGPDFQTLFRYDIQHNGKTPRGTTTKDHHFHEQPTGQQTNSVQWDREGVEGKRGQTTKLCFVVCALGLSRICDASQAPGES